MREGSARGGSADRSGGIHYRLGAMEFTDALQNSVLAVGCRYGQGSPFHDSSHSCKCLSHDSGRNASGICERSGLTLQHECFILQPVEFVREDEEAEKCG